MPPGLPILLQDPLLLACLIVLLTGLGLLVIVETHPGEKE
tara:strand:+ start:121 stop:240 length:120 start_codon:yes stop_codon:yes gene_type:complete